MNFDALNQSETGKGLGADAMDLISGGVPQTGAMVAIVTALAQPFGREDFKGLLDQVFGLGVLAGFSMLIAALVISFLIALFHVRYNQKLCGGKCMLSVILVWLILFSMSIGANNSFKTFGNAPEDTAMLKENERLRGSLAVAIKKLESIDKKLNEKPISGGVSLWNRMSFISYAHAQPGATEQIEGVVMDTAQGNATQEHQTLMENETQTEEGIARKGSHDNATDDSSLVENNKRLSNELQEIADLLKELKGDLATENIDLSVEGSGELDSMYPNRVMY